MPRHQKKYEIHLFPVAYAEFWKGGGAENSENLRMTKIRMKNFSTQNQSDFPVQNQMKTKKKGLYSNLARFLAQN